MQLTQKTQVDIDITNIEDSIRAFTNALNASIFTLNIAHNALWSLPDDRLRDVLQKLYDNGKLKEVFENHNYSANCLNNMQLRSNTEGPKAIDVAGREFEILNGQIVLKIISSEKPIDDNLN